MKKTISLKELKKHPWYTNLKKGIFLFPIEEIDKIRYKLATKTSDMGDGTSSQFSNETIWSSILEQGMRDPLYILISNTPEGEATIRLETGNHRIQTALDNKITHLPVVAFCQLYPIFHQGNGDHVYHLDKELLNNYYSLIGRDTKYFESYPHPIDLVQLFPNLNIYYSEEIEIIEEKSGYLYFK